MNDQTIGQDQHTAQRRARIVAWQTAPHDTIPDWCQHGIGYESECLACEDDEDEIARELIRRDAEPTERADVEGE